MAIVSDRPGYTVPGASLEAMLLESITDAFLAVDGEWRYRFVNGRAAALLGHPASELVGRVVWDVFPDAADSALANTLRRVMRERRAEHGEAYSFMAHAWVEYNAYPTADGVAWQMHDASLRKRAEESALLLADAGTLLASSLDVRETLDHLAALVVPRLASGCTIDLLEEGELRRVATAYDDPASEQELRALRERLPIARVAGHPVHHVVATGEPYLAAPVTDDLRRRLVGGDEELASMRAVGFTSMLIVPLTARGHTLGAVTLGTRPDRRMFDAADMALAADLAQRAALAVDNAMLFAEAQVMRHEAEAANQAKAEFLATMSHELRTPLTAIRGFLELVLDRVAGPLTADQEDHLRRVNGASEHLLVLVEEVLGFARLQAGRAEVRVRPVMLDDLVDGAVNLVRPMLDRKGLALRRRTPPDEVRLLTDADKVRQILVNLLSNAVKFTDRGEIGVEAVLDGDQVCLAVSDTGTGIPAEQLGIIFEPFRQGDQSLTRRAGGAGLGLAVAARLAELLGGAITVNSAPGAGSVFRFRMPRRHQPVR